MRLLIVGFDPGITSGIALLSTDGEVLLVTSRKNASLAWVIKTIIDEGLPLMICADKARPSRIISELSAKFNALLITPDQDLKKFEKSELARGEELENAHERDALAAARHALKRFKPLINRIKLKTTEEEAERVIREVILTRKNIQRSKKETSF